MPKLDIPALQAKTKRKPLAAVTTVPNADAEIQKELDDLPVVKKFSIPLWEAKWTREALLDKRSAMGAREFDRGYRQRAIADEDLLFKPEWIDLALDRSMVVPDHVEKKSFWYKLHRDAGVDLAIATADKEADYFAVCGIVTTRDWHRWVMHLERLRGLTFNQQVGLILECQDRYAYDIVHVESNAYQESIVRHLGEEGIAGRVNVQGYKTGRLQKVDKDLGIPSMAVEFEQGRWHIPYGDARSRRIMEPLIEELRIYAPDSCDKGVHDDTVMAAFFAREVRRINVSPTPRIRLIRY